MKERSPKTKQGVFAPKKEELSKGRGNCVENAGIEKARIPCDCLFLSYQGYKSVLTDSPHKTFHSFRRYLQDQYTRSTNPVDRIGQKVSSARAIKVSI